MSRWLPKWVSNLLGKARESATLAVDIYNKPRTDFRSGGFIVLICIAWLALLHSVFEKRKKIYFYYQKDWKKFEKIDGDKKAWELDKSAKEFFWNKSPEYINICFLIKLRNKIEHRFMPYIDNDISGECQASLINFEKVLISEYWEKYSLIETLYIPLQFSNKKRLLPVEKDERKVLDFISDFRDNIDPGITQQQEYSFKMFILPKIGNQRKADDLSVEFVKFNPKDPSDMEKYEKLLIWIKDKQVGVANQWKYRPGKILEILKKITWIKKNPTWHTKMWKKYNVRPWKTSMNYKICDTKYCQYDEASTTKDYVYTDEWIELLVTEINTEK